MASTGPSALIIGATGHVGKHVLRELLGTSHFASITEAGRRVTPTAELPPSTGKDFQQTVIDFEKTDELKEVLGKGKWDVVFITLGTKAKVAGSPENFEKIDRQYVLNAATAAKASEPGHSQRLVYCSAALSNPSSSLLYSRSKGLTEKGLASLGYSDVIIFRPAMLQNMQRDHHVNIWESTASVAANFLGHFTSSLGIDIDKLAKSMRIAGQLGSEKLPPSAAASKTNWGGESFTAIGNSGATHLAAEDL
ncbi:hypothetical protein BV25DRAFT_1239964 [Artomyces pyxidatus]|uniref:Uncharacterized protein n=1 Tax=Artomyces pyxidatus TaxID=48021 RepID=A0ACB8SQW7_9AGAM|nr:hypothetical protein BV25DRAFT_1239964 [Artomyces pyxidatus]